MRVFLLKQFSFFSCNSALNETSNSLSSVSLLILEDIVSNPTLKSMVFGTDFDECYLSG